ncbi:lysophospholipid acyltransferase family protein [Streptomyces sp. NRRL S-118]|uniref:lysophospholipid acyltransferase family protein n=1 Tax=Streptomyces sp. NRRL S-118 TaxID=1463881 RepID=UPI000694FFD9|nr:lysophospholipid acyltransferase family protein [Streptomyces sp. NRRL S-118]
MLLYWTLRYVFPGPFLWLLFRLRVEGAEHVPAQGPLVLACDHLSFLDPILVQLGVRRRVVFAAKQEYFTGRGLLGLAVRLFFKATGMIPMDRSGGPAAEEAIAVAVAALEDGKVVGIFPEGTRSPDGRLYRGRTGVGRLVVASRAPVVPVAVIGTDRILPPGKWLPRVGQATIRFGRPMEFTESSSRAITDEVMGAVQQLSGRPYVDAYAPIPARGRWGRRLEGGSC